MWLVGLEDMVMLAMPPAGAFCNFASAINASRAIHLRKSKVFSRDVR
jgi:hypothetical protein